MLIKTVDSGTGDVQAISARNDLIVWGFSFSESASSASTAEIILYHGTDNTGQELVAPVNFAADGFGYPIFFPRPVYCPDGLYLERVSGETTVVIYYDYQLPV